MKDFTVTYSLEEDELERLIQITESYRKRGYGLPIEEMFKIIMRAGCKYDIDEKFKDRERALGLRED